MKKIIAVLLLLSATAYASYVLSITSHYVIDLRLMPDNGITVAQLKMLGQHGSYQPFMNTRLWTVQGSATFYADYYVTLRTTETAIIDTLVNDGVAYKIDDLILENRNGQIVAHNQAANTYPDDYYAVTKTTK